MLELLWALFAIVLIDLVLAGDNALVIGMAANKLPEDLKKKAIYWGTAGAIIARLACVAVLSYILLIPGLKLVGGLLLIYIAWKLVFDDKQHNIEAKTTLWSAVWTIIVADVIMSMDNALAIAAAANGNMYLVIFGLLISIPMVIFGSQIVVKILNKWPDSLFVGSFVLFVVAIEMILSESFIDRHLDPLADWSELALPWMVGLFLTAKQYYRARIRVK